MNWKIIVIYTLVHLVSIYMAGFFTVFISILQGTGVESGAELYVVQAVLSTPATLIVFFCLARFQREMTALHAVAVLGISAVVEAAIAVALGLNFPMWLWSKVWSALMATIGTVIGWSLAQALRHRLEDGGPMEPKSDQVSTAIEGD